MHTRLEYELVHATCACLYYTTKRRVCNGIFYSIPPVPAPYSMSSTDFHLRAGSAYVKRTVNYSGRPFFSSFPFLALPCLALPCLALPCLALPCLALPCLALPCLALPCLALPCLAYLCKYSYKIYKKSFISFSFTITSYCPKTRPQNCIANIR